MTDYATPAKVRLTDGLGALVERLRACADDPMWANHAEVPKALCAAAARALQEANDLAGHYMAQRDEERRRMARAVQALGIAGQCIHAAANDQWASFDALSDDFDDAVAEVMTANGALKITPESMRQAVAQADQMLAVDLCSNCLTPDACYLRGQCEANAVLVAAAPSLAQRLAELVTRYSMDGVPNDSVPAFDAALQLLRELGHPLPTWLRA